MFTFDATDAIHELKLDTPPRSQPKPTKGHVYLIEDGAFHRLELQPPPAHQELINAIGSPDPIGLIDILRENLREYALQGGWYRFSPEKLEELKTL